MIPYSLKLGKCAFVWLVDNTHCDCGDNWDFN